MGDASFSVKEALLFGARTTREHFFMLLGAMAVVLLVRFGLGMLVGAFEESGFPVGVIVFIAWGIDVVMMMGIVQIALKLYDHAPVTISELFSPYNKLFAYVAGAILYGAIVLLGLVALIVPGIIAALRFQFFPQIIIDQNVGPIAALKQSGALTRGVTLKLLGLGVVLAIINMIGAVLVVGLAISVPVSTLAMVYVYRALGGKAGV